MAESAYDLVEVGEEDDSRELSTNAGALSQITGSEIEAQISVAKRYPRSIRTFQREAMEMVTLSEEIAGECMYALPRGGKKIEGPSARFAEVIASAWGNCRAGARVMAEDGKFVTAMGFFFDTQRNVAITYEVQRRITDKHGKTFNDDMIGVTANAACSIALRNAILKGVPKAFWKGMYDAARSCAIGNAETLGERRTKMLQYFAKMGAQPDKVFALLEVAGEQDISLDHLATLKGLATSIKDGDTTVDQAFNLESSKQGVTKGAPIKKPEPKQQEQTEQTEGTLGEGGDAEIIDPAMLAKFDGCEQTPEGIEKRFQENMPRVSVLQPLVDARDFLLSKLPKAEKAAKQKTMV